MRDPYWMTQLPGYEALRTPQKVNRQLDSRDEFIRRALDHLERGSSPLYPADSELGSSADEVIELWVDNENGDDELNSGLTQDKAFRTIKRAVEALPQNGQKFCEVQLVPNYTDDTQTVRVPYPIPASIVFMAASTVSPGITDRFRLRCPKGSNMVPDPNFTGGNITTDNSSEAAGIVLVTDQSYAEDALVGRTIRTAATGNRDFVVYRNTAGPNSVIYCEADDITWVGGPGTTTFTVNWAQVKVEIQTTNGRAHYRNVGFFCIEIGYDPDLYTLGSSDGPVIFEGAVNLDRCFTQVDYLEFWTDYARLEGCTFANSGEDFQSIGWAYFASGSVVEFRGGCVFVPINSAGGTRASVTFLNGTVQMNGAVTFRGLGASGIPCYGVDFIDNFNGSNQRQTFGFDDCDNGINCDPDSVGAPSFIRLSMHNRGPGANGVTEAAGRLVSMQDNGTKVIAKSNTTATDSTGAFRIEDSVNATTTLTTGTDSTGTPFATFARFE